MKLEYGKTVWYAGDKVYEASAIYPVTDERGVVKRWAITYMHKDGKPVVNSPVPKRHLYETEVKATKAIFTRKLKEGSGK